MKGKRQAVGHWLREPFLCRQLGLVSYGGYQWCVAWLQDSSRKYWHHLGGWQLGAADEIKGLSVFADWRTIASCSWNMAWRGSTAVGSVWQCISTGEVSMWHHGDPSATLHSVVVPHHPAPVQIVSVNSEKLLEGKWLILSKETETGLCFNLQNKAALVACNWMVDINEGKKAFELEDCVAQLWGSFRWKWRSWLSEEEGFRAIVGRRCREIWVLIFIDEHLHLATLSSSVLITVVSPQGWGISKSISHGCAEQNLTGRRNYMFFSILEF